MQTVTERVVDEVADRAGVSPLELPPIYEAIDPDALDRLFSGSPDDTAPSPPDSVTFAYAGYSVTVYRDRSVRIAAPTADAAAADGAETDTEV